MRYHKQLISHNPPHTYGDCFRTCLACLLDLEQSAVPHFFDGDIDAHVAWRAVEEWLSERKLGLFQFPVTSAPDPQGTPHSRFVSTLRWLSVSNRNIPFLVNGRRPGTAVNHFVIARNGLIAHDPSPNPVSHLEPISADIHYWINILTMRS